MGCIHGGLHLGRGLAEDFRIGTGPCAGSVVRMGEEAGGSPEQLCLAASHFLFNGVDHLLQVSFAFLDVRTFGGNVTVVEAEEVDADLPEELEKHLGPMLGILDRFRSIY